jgi:hypothetical protein
MEDGSVRVLITSSRMPFALGMVRKLAAEGHAVYAADDYALSPGSHSKYLAGHFVYPSPRRDTAGFLAGLERIVREHEIDVLVPAFEETFYISTRIERLSRFTRVFASPFPVLARLHDKGAFQRLVTSLGLPVPETVLVTSQEELREAAGRLGDYFARAAFSRGGICCLTNTGPHRPSGRHDRRHELGRRAHRRNVTGRRHATHRPAPPAGRITVTRFSRLQARHRGSRLSCAAATAGTARSRAEALRALDQRIGRLPARRNAHTTRVPGTDRHRLDAAEDRNQHQPSGAVPLPLTGPAPAPRSTPVPGVSTGLPARFRARATPRRGACG